MVLSGGLSYDTVGRRACLTVMHGKSTTVLEMDFPIVDFLTLCETPYPNGEKHICNLVVFFSSYKSDHSIQKILLTKYTHGSNQTETACHNFLQLKEEVS